MVTAVEEMKKVIQDERYALQFYMPLSENVSETVAIDAIYKYITGTPEDLHGTKLAEIYRKNLVVDGLNEEKIDNIDEETRKELEKSYKHIDAMMEKYRIENFEVNQKEKVPSVKKARLEKVQINQEKMAVIDREVEHEENGEERE